MSAKLMLLIRVIDRRLSGGETLESVLESYPGLSAQEKQAIAEHFQYRRG